MDTSSRIYVAGHTGMLGNAISAKLQDAGYKNRVTAPHSELDLTDRKAVHAFFQDQRPDVVIDCAAKVGGILANTLQPTEFLEQNALMQIHVLLEAKNANVDTLLTFGTACMYPREAEQPLQEDAILSAALETTNAPYAIAKLAGTMLCSSIRTQYNKNFFSAIPTNMYGPHDHFDLQQSHVIPALILKFHKAKTENMPQVAVWGSGSATRDFLFVDDCADACLHLLENGCPYERINVGSGTEVSIRSLVETIRTVVQYEGDVVFQTEKLEGVPRRCLDTTKLSKLGWRASTSLEDGLRQTYEWFTHATVAV